MAEKKNPKARGPNLNDVGQTVVINQALVLADTFSRRYTPISLEMPRIYIFACNHSKLVQDHILKSHWCQVQGLRVHVQVSKQCSSIGEALREVKLKNLFTGDFVLVFGDVVSNLRIDAVLQAHRERREKSKSAIMTMVLKKASPAHPTRSIEDDTVVALDPTTGELLAYENAPKSRKFKLATALLGKCDVQLRYDLLDCHIDVCSPEVLLCFEDNPDYQDVRRDFIKGTLNDDVFNYHIYTHILSGEYAARAKDLRTYAATSKDVLHRWVYPITPESNLLGGSYQHLRGPIYREKDVKLSIVECHIYPSTIIGGGSTVGAHSIIRSSVIGRNCVIGAHCRIEGAFIWDNVTIADNTTIVSSVLCSGVSVGAGSKIEGGCVLSFNVILGPGVRLEPHTRLTTAKPNPAEYDDSDPTVAINLGNGGVGRKWAALTKEELQTSLEYDAARFSRDDSSDSEFDFEGDGPDSDEEDGGNKELADETDYADLLLKDVVETFLENQHIAPERMDDLARELKVKRTTYNKDLTLTVFDVSNSAIIGVLTVLARALPAAATARNIQEAIVKGIEHWKPLLEHFVFNKNTNERVIAAETGYLKKAKEFLSTEDGKRFAPYPAVVLKALYDEDIITDEAVESWKKEEDSSESGKAFLAKCQQFFDYLEPEEEDEEEEGDE